MKNAKKLILVLAVAVFALACAACGKKENDPTPTPTQAATNTPTPTEDVKPTEPPRDLKGLEVVLGDWWSGEDWNKANNAYEEAYYEMLNDSMKNHNYTFTRKNLGGWGPEYTEAQMLAISKNEPMAQIITFDATWTAALLSQGAFLDVWNISTVDWSDSKWNKACIDAMKIGGGLYGFAAGTEPRTGVFFNKAIFKQLGVDPELPYNLQAEGKWNWDAFKDLAKSLTKDTDNDGATDIFGVTGQNTVWFTAFLMSNGTHVITQDATGKLVMNANDTAVLDALNYGRTFYDEGYFCTEKEGDAWDYFKAAFYDGRVAMFIEEQYAISNINEQNIEAGFVCFPYGPAVNKPISIVRENVLIVPSCDSTKSVAEDIMYAYNVYTSVPEEYADDDQRWKAHYEALFNDERAVNETCNFLINKYDQYMNASFLIPSFAPNWLYELGGGATGAETVEAHSAEWQTQVDEFNAAFN